MLRMISPKALIVSNVAHWIFFLTGWVVAFLLYCAGATISSDGTAGLVAVFDEMKSSSGLLAATTLVFFMAPIPAGYIAAKIAPHEKLLNGALSTSAWLVFCLYYEISGGGGGDSTVDMPHWLSALTNYGVPIPAMLGAYLWHLRADRGAFATADIHQEWHATAELQRETPMPPTAPKQNQARRFGRAGTGLGIFLFLLMQFLLTRHEQNVLFVAMIVALALVVVIKLVSKALKNSSG
jgi:hypothetical protein